MEVDTLTESARGSRDASSNWCEYSELMVLINHTALGIVAPADGQESEDSVETADSLRAEVFAKSGITETSGTMCWSRDDGWVPSA